MASGLRIGSRARAATRHLPGRSSARERLTAYALISVLLRYPDEGLMADLPLLEQASGSLPQGIGSRLLPPIRWLARTPLLQAQAEYVTTFDLRRKSCLYLSYYLNGDTRRRGEALWRFQEACHRAGFRVRDGELADFLPLLLELAASGGEDEAIALIADHRAGLELLGTALTRADSPYASLITVVTGFLPVVGPARLAARTSRLIAEGPPSELVGIGSAAPFGTYRPGEGAAESEKQ